MGNVRILNDNGGVYEQGSIVDVGQLITDYCDCTDDQGIIDYLWRIPIPSAIDFIAEAWGIEYEFV